MARSRKSVKDIPMNKERENTAKVIDALLKTDNGRRFFEYLCKSMGFFENTRTINNINQDILGHNEARRLYYLHLRDLATPELLAPVELAADKARRTAHQLLDAPKKTKGE